MTDKTYTQEELDAEVLGLKNKNAELIGTQKDLKTELAGLTSKLSAFDGVDIEALKTLAKSADSEKEADMLKNGQFDELMNLKLEAALQPLKTQLEQTQQALETEKQAKQEVSDRFNRTTTENYIRSESSKIGDIASTAIDDLVLRGSQSWRNVDGVMTLFDGDNQVFKDSKPVGFVDWAEGMRETHPHYFNQAQGTGAIGSQSKGGVNYEDAFKPESRNFTAQSELQKTSPDLYDTLNAKYNG